MSATFADQVETDDSGARIIRSIDCTPVFEALVKHEQNEMIGGDRAEEKEDSQAPGAGVDVLNANAIDLFGVQRSEEQQKKSTAELNDKLIEKENRRAEESAGRRRQQVDRH